MPRPIVVTLLIVIGVALGVTVAAFAPESRQKQPVEWLEKPRGLDSFKLHTNSAAFTNQSLEGKWTIVLFGFLHCPDVCPTSLAQLASVSRNLQAHGFVQDIDYVFVSVDPSRDSVSEVSMYVSQFDAAFYGVTGEMTQVVLFANDLGVRAKVSSEGGKYSVTHSTTFSIIDPHGMFRGRFRPGFDVPAVVQSMIHQLAG